MTKHKYKEQNISYYSASIINRDVEGILWVQLTYKQTREMFRLCVCYLPPVGSFWKLCAQGFYDSLLTHIYMHQPDCSFVICGDFKDRRYYLAVQRAQMFIGKNNRAACPTRVRLYIPCNFLNDCVRVHRCAYIYFYVEQRQFLPFSLQM